jgi:hypothetical protein
VKTVINTKREGLRERGREDCKIVSNTGIKASFEFYLNT